MRHDQRERMINEWMAIRSSEGDIEFAWRKLKNRWLLSQFSIPRVGFL